MSFELDVNLWAEREFGECELGDRRRTKRVVRLAAQGAAHPDGSTPDQTETWDQCKAAYRLIGNRHVDFKRLIAPHTRRTRAVEPGEYLVIQDTTFVCFAKPRKARGLGSVGDGGGQGFLLHTGLLMNAADEEVRGLAAQRIHYRKPAPEGETYSERMERERESVVWLELIREVGTPPAGARFIQVCDRGADNFEIYRECLQSGQDWVVRVAQHRRMIVTPEGKRLRLQAHVHNLPVLTSYTLSLRARPNQPARRVKLQVRAGAVDVPIPSAASAAVRGGGIRSIPMHVVEVREIDPPAGVEPLHWTLLTSLAVADAEAARRVVRHYEARWLIEEYHKALKTGCGLEQRQYQTAERLESICGILSVTAVRLLRLKSVARKDPDRPAEKVVPAPWIRMLSQVSKGKHRNVRTVGEFYRGLARLGGFLGRKHDGEPGWITLWRGFEKLQLMLRGVTAAETPKCG